MRERWFYFVLSILLVTPLLAQHNQKRLRFKHIDSHAGLSNGNVTAILQDSKGFLWVGTDDGLNRYDGYEFKVYRSIDDDSTSLVKNKIQCLMEDSRGRMWISTINSGLHYYDRDNDNFKRIVEFSHSHCQVMRIIEDEDHVVWIGGINQSQDFVARLDDKTGKWTSFVLFPSNDPIYSMANASRDELWLGTRLNGLIRWNKKTQKFTTLKHVPNSNSLPGDYIERMVKDSDGYWWIGTRNGLSRYDEKKNEFRNFTAAKNAKGTTAYLPADIIQDLCLDGDYLWIGMENGGLCRMHRKHETFEFYTYDKYDPFSIANNSIWSLYKDREGRLWIGSYAKGVCVLDKYETKFTEIELPLQNNLVNCLLRDSKERFWVGTEEGIILQENGKTTHFRHNDSDPHSISADPVNCIYEDSRHQVWTGYWGGGLNRYDDRTKGFVRYLPDPKNPHSISNPNVYAIVESSATNELLVCTFGGLNILKDQDKGIFETYANGLHEGDQLLLNAYEDRSKNLWVGSYSGLSQFDLKRKTYKEFFVTNDSSEVSDRINAILQDQKGTLWVTSHAGLHKKLANGQFKTYTTKDGLPVNVVQGILEDNSGHLWLGTTNGLVDFDPEHEIFKVYDERDGLTSADLRRKAFFKDKDGKLYVGGRGLNSFYPDSLRGNTEIPPVYITDFRIFNQSEKAGKGILSKSITATDEISIPEKASFFSIHYVALNFTASDKNRYAYKLDNFDNDWNYVNDLRFATYTNLNPGTYTFRVKASNNDGVWNEQGATLVIHILPPWWKTLWFRLLAIGLMASFIIGGYYLRVHTVEERNTKLRELVDQRTEQLQASNIELGKREQEITKQNFELLRTQEELAAQNEELVQGQEEVSAQRDMLAAQNKMLEEAHNIIESKNKEITEHNVTLELEVEKRTQELLSHNNQLEQFAFISAHNLRAPVARILGLGEVLKLGTLSEDDHKIIMEKLFYTTTELDRVVRDLTKILDIRKNNASVISSINLKEEVKLIKANLQKEIEDTRAVITEDFSSVDNINSVKPYVDSILMNLVSNAIKYRDPEREPLIQLQSVRGTEWVSLIVKDNGLGIDLPRHQDKLFKLYSRFHLHVEGKGMGLYLVKTQVDALGGELLVDSVINEGTTFEIKLPLKDSLA